jgi:hypothetical protein
MAGKKKDKAAYKIEKKRSGRFAVRGPNGKYINGDAKAEILSKEGKITGWKPAKKEEAAEAPAAE